MRLRPSGAFSLGVYFSHSYMDVGLVDLTGHLLGMETLEFAEATPALIANTAREALLDLTKRLEVDLDRVVGAGFALPGDFDKTGNKLKAHSYFPALWDCDLAAEFGAGMPVPVFFENDGAAAAIGERVHGVGRSYQTFLFIHIGHGVGGGLILEGRLFRGKHGNAGLLGGLYPLDHPRPSGQDLLETLKHDGIDVRDFRDLSELALTTPSLRKWIKRAGRQLRMALSVGGRFIDPEAIVLGGRMPPHILAAIYDAIDVSEAFDASRALPIPDVLPSKLGSAAGVIGAASVGIFKTFFEA